MSDGEDSMSEGFSASEDEWKPSKDIKGGESSDDDDSDYEGSPLAGAARGGTTTGRKRGEPKARSAGKQISSKKRTGLSLRTKLYNKYRPPPKTFSPTSSNAISKNSPSTSTSRTISKNATAPNESKSIKRKNENGEDSASSSDSSINNYLVNPKDLDIKSSFFNVEERLAKKSVSPEPVFDCNAGQENLSDSPSEDEKQGSIEKGGKSFDFNNLLEYAKTLERVKEAVAKHNTKESSKKDAAAKNIDTLDVYAVLALGEKQHNRSHNDGEDEDDEDDDEIADNKQRHLKNLPSKLNKTKSTRIKRHTKTRPTSIVAANDSDDSEWEEVADTSNEINTTATAGDISQIGNLEIHVDLSTRNKEKKTKTQEEIELAFKRKLNRDIRERQVLLHKASLLCHFGRSYFYNRLLNDSILMSKALKLLPSKSSYPTEKGTEIKYFLSMVTWFKSVIKLKTQNLYPPKTACKTKIRSHIEILKQIEEKEARCKQDMIFILIILLRGMGLQCRLVVNLQPLPLKPVASDLVSFKSKNIKTEEKEKYVSVSSMNKSEVSNSKNDAKQKTSKLQIDKKVNLGEQMIRRVTKKSSKNQKVEKEVKHSDKKNSPEASKEARGHKKIEIAKIKATLKKQEDNTGNENPKENKEVSLRALKSIKSSKPEKHTKNECKDRDKQNKKENTKLNKLHDGHQGANHTSLVKSQEVINGMNTNNSIVLDKEETTTKEIENSQKENEVSHLKRKRLTDKNTKPSKIFNSKAGSTLIPKIIIQTEKGSKEQSTELPSTSRKVRNTRSRSKSPQSNVSTAFLCQNKQYKEMLPSIIEKNANVKNKAARSKGPASKVKISGDFLNIAQTDNVQKRVLRSRQKTNEPPDNDTNSIEVHIPQLDGANDSVNDGAKSVTISQKDKKKGSNAMQIKVKQTSENSDDDFEPSPPKKPKSAPSLKKQNRRVLSSDDESDCAEKDKHKQTAGDMWPEVWCDIEEQWVCVDIFKGKIHCIDTIRKSASPDLSYVFAFQNDLSIKDVTARYCHNWSTVVRKSRIDKTWLDSAISKYMRHRTKRDIKEDEELRRIHEEKPMPTSIADYKNHPFFVLERHLLKFEALYPPNAPALGFVRGEPVYSRDCVHTLHSREIWLKQARTVKLGEKPYKIVKARPKWDRITQTVIKDQPLEIFGYWQTQDYEPPTAENGLVPRNAYGNVELFKPSMLPKKTVHIRLPGLNRICKKLGIDCANAVVGFDFHQGACHPLFDGFVVCEEFEDQVVATWHQDQEDQDRKIQEKYEARVYGNWKKLIRGLLIRERLKLKYNF